MCCSDTPEKEQQLQVKSENKQIKIVVLGESMVGKTSIISRFCFDTFQNKESTLGVAYQSTQITHKGQLIRLHIWDTAGAERYRSLAQLCYRDASIAIIVFDIMDRKSFEQVEYWWNELQDKCQSLSIGLAGNKCDMKELRVVERGEATEYSLKHNMIFSETSAATGEGIKYIFTQLIEKYLKSKT